MAVTKVGTGHSAGIFADMTLDGPEIGTLVAVIDRAKNLPNRKTMGKQDPYCAMRLGKEAKKTETDRRGGQTPKWDTELRFTVHESPDYYKLKCSVFNEDRKKTDLIGEAWIDLKEVIKPGGGQNDIWHQLNYKGKYAGDIRVEMTYYDSREKPVEKPKSRERTPVSTGERSSSTPDLIGGPRQLGPREVRRRPLPVSPSAASSRQEQQQVPPPPPAKPHINKLDPSQVHAPAPLRPHESQRPSSAQFQATYTNVNYDEPPYTQPYDDFENDQRQASPYYPNSPHDYETQHSSSNGSYQAGQYPTDAAMPIATRASSYPNEREIWQNSQPLPWSEPSTPYGSPSAHRPSPSSAASDGYIQQYRHQHKPSMSPTKAPVFRDSPLRQSMNHYDVTPKLLPGEEADALPPPPPVHRDTTPRRSQNDLTQNAYIPQPLRIGDRPAISERSPLQSIEDSLTSARPVSSFEGHLPVRESSYDPYRRGSNEASSVATQQYPRRNSYNSQPLQTDERQPYVEDYQPGEYDATYPSYGYNVVEEPQQFSDERYNRHEGFRNSSGSDSAVQRRSVSPNPQHTVIRKSISPGPYPRHSNAGLSSVPFSPDAYDVLNPASSPVTNEKTLFETPEQARESARLREVAKARDLGPIIGNDGRVIDPSDHLPSDTWAPEPEKKTRKPEHVVHIRTKNDSRTPNRQASPVVIRNSPYHTSPIAGSPQSAPPSTGSRNRLQKQVPVRPLPVQPYPQSQPSSMASSPAAESPSQRVYDHNAYQDYSPKGLVRPALSEYQIPVNNSYSPRGASYEHEIPTTPTRGPQYGGGHMQNNNNRSHHGSPYADPLAMELSMIDIGPSRGGRTALRSNRGY